jgi:hypothetical protein
MLVPVRYTDNTWCVTRPEACEEQIDAVLRAPGMDAAVVVWLTQGAPPYFALWTICQQFSGFTYLEQRRYGRNPSPQCWGNDPAASRRPNEEHCWAIDARPRRSPGHFAREARLPHRWQSPWWRRRLPHRCQPGSADPTLPRLFWSGVTSPVVHWAVLRAWFRRAGKETTDCAGIPRSTQARSASEAGRRQPIVVVADCIVAASPEALHCTAMKCNDATTTGPRPAPTPCGLLLPSCSAFLLPLSRPCPKTTTSSPTSSKR